MKILLTAVNAKYIHSNLAVYSLKASAGTYEPLIELAEYTINHQTDDIFCSIYQKKPDLLFLSCYIWNRRELLEITANVRKVLPETVIWIGGPEVSYDAAEVLRENPQIDGVMMGEGEETFRKVLAYYVDQKGTLAEISGIAYRIKENSDGAGNDAERSCQSDDAMGNKGDGININAPAVLMRTLDDLPFVYHRIEDFANRIIYYESSRGCPFSCSYCLSSIDKRVRFRSPELVEKELSFFLEHKVPQVKFVDRTFNCSHAHAQRIWRFIQEHDNGVTNFHFEIAADLLNEEEIALLGKMRPGLVQLEIGVQTVNERTLDAIHRTAKFEKITERVHQITAYRNIHQHLDLIAGLPYEDFESFKTSFDTVYSLRPQELQLGFLKVLKGSEMHQRQEEYGIVYRSEQPYEVLATKWISCDELMRLKEVEEMLEVHYNSQQFRNTILALEAYFERPFELYAALADYYKEEKLWGKSYSRQQRFVILRGFIRKILQEYKNASVFPARDARHEATISKARQMPVSDREEKWSLSDIETEFGRFDELLTLDFYLRENAKSRPEWAADLGGFRDRIAAFYQKEEQEHIILPAYDGMTWKQMMRMTHAERFGYGEKEYWLLFDYEQRDPLTYDAKVYEIDL